MDGNVAGFDKLRCVNPEHLELLQKPEWNEWRAARPALTPDFTDMRLHGVDLSGKNVAGADFSRSKLEGCNFEGANLARAPPPPGSLYRSQPHPRDPPA